MDGAVGGEERNKMEWRDRAESSSQEDDKHSFLKREMKENEKD